MRRKYNYRHTDIPLYRHKVIQLRISQNKEVKRYVFVHARFLFY